MDGVQVQWPIAEAVNAVRNPGKWYLKWEIAKAKRVKKPITIFFLNSLSVIYALKSSFLPLANFLLSSIGWQPQNTKSISQHLSD